MSDNTNVHVNAGMTPLAMPTLSTTGALLGLSSLVVELAEIVAANNWGSAEMQKAHQLLEQTRRLRAAIERMEPRP